MFYNLNDKNVIKQSDVNNNITTYLTKIVQIFLPV